MVVCPFVKTFFNFDGTVSDLEETEGAKSASDKSKLLAGS
jgi:hypothetical protein